MDNQQERLGLDFVAGLLTGEGSFSLAVCPGASQKVRPQISMCMKDVETVEIVADILRRHELPVYIYRRKTGLACLVIAGFKRCKVYADTFEPLLTGEKKTACRIMREFIELRLSRPKHGDIPLDERVLIQKLRDHNAPTQNKRKAPLPLS